VPRKTPILTSGAACRVWDLCGEEANHRCRINQFGHQQPGDDAEISNFCETTYRASFPIFAKIEVDGPSQHPLFAHPKARKGGRLGSAIKWNFTKFMVERDGTVLDQFAPPTTPESIAPLLEAALAAVPPAG
jgi:glutathione peroxidase